MQILQRIPYDVLQVILEWLDRKTLYSTCLASHALNEVASVQLYHTVLLNKKRPLVWGPGKDLDNDRIVGLGKIQAIAVHSPTIESFHRLFETSKA